jgi:two-component SAPR family response regulator
MQNRQYNKVVMDIDLQCGLTYRRINYQCFFYNFGSSKIKSKVRFLIIIFSILSYGLNSFGQDELLSGLYFSSHEVIQDNRTTLNLTPEGPFKFPDGFSLEMDANFRRGDGHYGYIFRIIGDENTNIDLVSNLASTSANFWLVIKDKVLCSYKWTDIPNGGFDRWIKIKVNIDIRNSKLEVSFNGNAQVAEVADISGLKNFEMVFGACRNTSFLNTDVSPMSLKNIRIFDAKNKLIRDWKLSKHSEPKVYDEIRRAEALVENPIWSIDKHVKWEKIEDVKINNIQGIAKDEENGRVFLIDNKAVYVFSIATSAIDTIPFAGGLPYLAIGRQIIYNKFTNELWSYDFYKNEISKFSFITNKWSLNEATSREPEFWHHNKFISPIDSSLVTLFGYGFYTYKSIIGRYNAKLKVWEQIDRLEQIQPRYLSGSGFLNNREMLVFGGYGSKTGRQELSPEFYYDLYLLNLNDYSFKKLWILDTPSTPFVPCETLITDQQNGVFYTLIYNRGSYSTFLRLAKFSIEKNEYQLFNDSIPYNFLDTKSWSTLFLDRKTSQLIAVTSHNSEVSLYSIAYPPLMPEDVYQSIPKKGRWYFWLFGSLITGGLILVAFILFRKKRPDMNKDGLYKQVEHPNILPIEPFSRKTISSIYFMGGFQIFNRKGQNITSSFSPTLKQLFLFIFLHTIKNGKGVTSAKLDEVLWFDKSGESARNNRNVNISKLRTILDEVDGVEVVNENSFWKIKSEDPVFCDYCEILNLFSKSKSTALTEDKIKELIALLSFGEFLPAVQNDWMDGFKSQFDNETIDGLSSLFNETDVKNNFSLRYHLAECILVYDPLNDEAFAMKCSVLYNLGKKSMAKNLYDSYCREYKKVLGIDYTTSFNDMIRK